jgi:predicted phage tail protein
MPFDGVPSDPIPPRQLGAVRAIVFYNPLDPKDRTIADLDWAPNKTVAEYLAGLPEGVEWAVAAAGRMLPREQWASTTLLEDDVIILSVLPQKGFGRMFGMVLMLALAVAAPYIAGAILGPTGTLFGLSAAASKALLSSIITIGGSMLISALLPAPKPDLPDRRTSDSSSSPSYGIDGPKSTAREDAPVPAVYGTFRVGGNRINYYAENTDNGKAQDLFMQFAVSEGPIDAISDIQINNQPISNFKGVETAVRMGERGQQPLAWFNDTITPYFDGRTVTTSDILYTTIESVDRIRLDFNFPNGLYEIVKETGDRRSRTVGIEAYAEPLGGGGLIPFRGEKWEAAQISGTGLVVIPSTSTARVGQRIRVTVTVNGSAGAAPTTPYSVRTQVWSNGTKTGAPLFDKTESGAIVNLYRSDGNWAAGTITHSYEIDSNSSTAITWSAQIDGGTAFVQVLQINAGTAVTFSDRNSVRFSLSSPPLARGRYVVRVKRTTPQAVSDYISDQLVLSEINEITADAVNYNRTAYYAVKVRLTEQLSGEPNVSALVRGRKVWRYDRNGNRSDFSWSDNPADIALDILLSEDWRRPLLPSRIDFPAFHRWRQFCESNSLKFNGTFDFLTNVWDALTTVMRVGRASPVIAGLKWSVVIEGPDAPVMLFGAQNMLAGSFEVFWQGRADRANSIEGQFYDETDGYRRKSVYAIDEAALARGEPLRQVSVNLLGVTRAQQAKAEVDLQLRLNQLVVQGCKFQAHVDAIGSVVGDLIYVQHDMPKWGWADRLAGVTGSGIGATLALHNPLSSQDGGVEGDPMPDGDWRVLVLKPAVERLTRTITAASGVMISVALVDSATRITRVMINGQDYQVTDRVDTSVTTFTLDRDPGSVVGLTAGLWQTDMMIEGTIARPNVGASSVTLTGWSHSVMPAAGDHVLIGRVGKFKKIFRVMKMTRDHEKVCTLECEEYVEAVYNPSGESPVVETELQIFPLHVVNLRTEQFTRSVQGGGVLYFARAIWTRPLNDIRGHAGAHVWVARGDGDFEFHESVGEGRRESVVETAVGEVVRFRVIAFDRNGFMAPTISAPTAAITIGARVRAPLKPVGLTATGGVRLIGLRWDRPADPDVKLFEVFENTSNNVNTAYKIVETASNAYTVAGLMPNVQRWYWVRSVSYAGEFSGFEGPVNATTSLLVADDIQNGILETAKFASSIRPVATPATQAELVAAKSNQQLVFPQTALTDPVTLQALQAQRLYRWDGSAWRAVVSANDLEGQIGSGGIADGAIVAGKIAAGAVSANEIAGSAVRAVHLASETIITQTIQIGNAVIGAANIQDGSIGTAKIGDAVITTAKIGDLQVDTIKIRNGAVTESASVSGSTTHPTQTINLSFYSDGTSPILVLAQQYHSGAWENTSDNSSYFPSGGSVSRGGVAVGNVGDGGGAIVARDIAPIGWHTYSMRGGHQGTTSHSGMSGTMALITLKR